VKFLVYYRVIDCSNNSIRKFERLYLNPIIFLVDEKFCWINRVKPFFVVKLQIDTKVIL